MKTCRLDYICIVKYLLEEAILPGLYFHAALDLSHASNFSFRTISKVSFSARAGFQRLENVLQIFHEKFMNSSQFRVHETCKTQKKLCIKFHCKASKTIISYYNDVFHKRKKSLRFRSIERTV